MSINESLVNSIAFILGESVRKSVFPGAVCGLIDHNGDQQILAAGRHRPGDSRLMCENDIFDVASITKAIPTSILALQALDENRISLNTRIAEILPGFDGPRRELVTLRHLLTHTIEHAFALSSLRALEPRELLRRILSDPLPSLPGSKFFYSNATSVLLGLVVERVLGGTLDSLAEKRIFRPLSMLDSSFNPDKMPPERIVPTEIDEWRGREVRGETHDESAYVLSRLIVPGSAGLFSTVPDLLKVVLTILNRGTQSGYRLISPELLDRVGENQIAELGECTGLGWELNQARYMGNCDNRQIIGKTGFTGCMITCDLQTGRGVVLLSNYTYPSRKDGPDLINSVRRKICGAVFAS